MNFDHAFIITYGRSGSTLLQGILNTIPGADIRGENGNLLFFIYRMYEALKIGKRYAPVADETTHPWYGAGQIPHDDYHEGMLALFRRDILMPGGNGRLTGFKEIRFDNIGYPLLSGYVAYLRDFFPRCAVIFNTRELDAVIESNRRAKHFVSADKIRQADINFRRLAKEHPGFCHLTQYDDYNGRPEALRGLFQFLGAPFDAARIAETMSQTHSVRTSSLSLS
ncbi:MAG: sulfotransferase [Paracoccus sp. (in: a-proteobacteria)]